MKHITLIVLAAGCLHTLGCGSTRSHVTGARDPLGPFSKTFWRQADHVRMSMETGSVEELHALHVNVQGMAAWSLWSLYPRGGAFPDSSAPIFTGYIYTVFESEIRHWEQVIRFGKSEDAEIALSIMRSRAGSLIGGAPYAAVNDRIEGRGFPLLLGMLSNHILPDLVPLVKANISRWPPNLRTAGLCVLAHAGDEEAISALTRAMSRNDEGSYTGDNTTVTTILIYRTCAQLGKTWPTTPSESTR